MTYFLAIIALVGFLWVIPPSEVPAQAQPALRVVQEHLHAAGDVYVSKGVEYLNHLKAIGVSAIEKAVQNKVANILH